MVSPIRIKGAGGGGSSPSTGLSAVYESPDGDQWGIVSPDGIEHQRVVLVAEEVSGLAGRVEWTEAESVTRYGVRNDGWKIPPLEISLGYVLRAAPGEMETVSRMWEQAWSYSEPGKLALWSAAGEYFWTPVSDPVFPDWSEALRRQRLVRGEVSCLGKLGHWFGTTEYFTGSVVVRPPGDRPLSPSLRLRWDGSATSLTFPSGLKVNLPAIGVTRYINLDRGMSGQMTTPEGVVDTGGWSSLQGIVHGVSLRPGQESDWVLGDGLTLEMTPRYLSPWR